MMIGAFFPAQYRVLAMIGLYVFGILCGMLYALLLKITKFRGEPVPFVMELPNYRLPSAKSVGQLIWEKAKDFIQKAFTVIFAASIIVWILQNFDVRLNIVESPEDSLLALLGGFVAPIFAPLGFGDWRASTALLTGFTAKESVVSTLTLAARRRYLADHHAFYPVHCSGVPRVRAAVHSLRCRDSHRQAGAWQRKSRRGYRAHSVRYSMGHGVPGEVGRTAVWPRLKGDLHEPGKYSDTRAYRCGILRGGEVFPEKGVLLRSAQLPRLHA